MILAVTLAILAVLLACYGVLKVREDVRAGRSALIWLGVAATGGGTLGLAWGAYMVAVFIWAGGL